ncbi:MAG: hypothetical protein GY795_23300 [Desulfobacterales bacterium]|nr:hypothetical protein [Desulfobacterales bacterium]
MRAYITALSIIASVSLLFPACANASGSPGDMNGDGNIDLADTALVLQVLSDMNPVVHFYSDINGDSRLGTEEVIYTLQKFSGLRTDSGDINADGNVDVRDAILGLKILSGMDTGYVYPSADVNNDKRISIDEVFFILRIIAGGKSKIKDEEADIKTGRRRYSYDISLEATTDGRTVDSIFPPGSDLYLNIDLAADSNGVAGCAFTLIYPIDKLTAPITDCNNIPDNPSSPDITSIFPFKTTEKYTRCENSVPGRIKFIGTEINPEGGPVFHYYDTTFFTVKFTVKDYAVGDIKFELVQTTLNNPDAGWNGEGVPVIVSSIPATDPNFGGDLSDDFPVLLENFVINPTLSVETDEYYCSYLWCCSPDDWCCPDYYGWCSVIGGPNDDFDHDGLTNKEEINFGSDPTNQDSPISNVDNVDVSDPTTWLIVWPNDDFDHDGFTNHDELIDIGSDPTDQDSPIANVDNIDVTDPTTWPSDYNALTDFRVSNLDIDGNGEVTSEDHKLLYNWISDLRGDDSLTGGLNCTRCTAEEISAYIDAVERIYDVNAIRKTTLEDCAIIDLYIDPTCTPCTQCLPDNICEYIKKLIPG